MFPLDIRCTQELFWCYQSDPEGIEDTLKCSMRSAAVENGLLGKLCIVLPIESHSYLSMSRGDTADNLRMTFYQGLDYTGPVGRKGKYLRWMLQ